MIGEKHFCRYCCYYRHWEKENFSELDIWAYGKFMIIDNCTAIIGEKIDFIHDKKFTLYGEVDLNENGLCPYYKAKDAD